MEKGALRATRNRFSQQLQDQALAQEKTYGRGTKVKFAGNPSQANKTHPRAARRLSVEAGGRSVRREQREGIRTRMQGVGPRRLW